MEAGHGAAGIDNAGEMASPGKWLHAALEGYVIGSDGVDASLKWCSTPPLWHIDAVGGRPPHQCRFLLVGRALSAQPILC